MKNGLPQIICDETRLPQICDDLPHLQMICGHLFFNVELKGNSFILSVVIRNIRVICVLISLDYHIE